MTTFQKKLYDLVPEKKYFIGIDSDGCVFDTMELKHKECFCPAYIDALNLQGVSRYAREVWDFVNLYSKTRGINRFEALLESADLLRNRSEVITRKVDVPVLAGLRSWIERESHPGGDVLRDAVKRRSDPDLLLALTWSEDVTARIQKMVRGVKPFSPVEQCLQRIETQADTLVISQAPVETLQKEWKEHGIDLFVREIAGQEMGTKTQHLEIAAAGKYAPENILMIGDAPGDYRAAEKNGALFFPIIPGKEDASWEELLSSGLDKFFSGTFSGSYQEELLRSFEESLPSVPPWEK